MLNLKKVYKISGRYSERRRYSENSKDDTFDFLTVS